MVLKAEGFVVDQFVEAVSGYSVFMYKLYMRDDYSLRGYLQPVTVLHPCFATSVF